MGSPLSILFTGTGLAIVRLAAGLVRSKWIASSLGLPGVGLSAQATQFQLVAAAMSSFSTSAAVIQGAKGPFRERSEDVYRCAWFLNLAGFSASALAAVAIGFSNAGSWLMGPGFGTWEFALLFLSLPFAQVASCFLECAFFVSDRFDRYAVTSALHAIGQSICVVLATWMFGLRGLLLAFPISALFLAFLFAGDLYRMGNIKLSWFYPRWEPKIAAFLLRHGIVMFLTGVGGGFLLLAARSALVSATGLGNNGVLQVPIALSAYGSAIMTNFLWGRVHPRFSTGEEKSSFELSLCVVAAFAVSIGIWCSSPLFVPLIYSRDFAPAIPLVSLQCAGDVLYYSFFALAVALLASGGAAAYLACWLAYYAPLALLFTNWIPLAPRSFMLLHAAGATLALAACFLFALRRPPFRRRELYRLFFLVAPLGAVAGAVFLSMESRPLTVKIFVSLALLTAGTGWWILCYGKDARTQLRQISDWVRRRGR